MRAGEVREESGDDEAGNARGAGGLPGVRLASRRLVLRDRPVATSLAELQPGARAVVAAVSPTGGPQIARRLLDLGFSPGTTVQVLRRAPLRDPVVYRLRGYDICLRRAQAGLIRVTAAS